MTLLKMLQYLGLIVHHLTLTNFSASEKKLILILVKQRQSFVLSLHYNANKLLVFKRNRNLQLITKIITFHLDFVLETYLMNLTVMI